LKPFIRRAGDGEARWFLTNHMTLKATADETGGGFGLVESLIAPGSSPPLHIHHGEDESFYVLEGELTFRVGDETFEGGPGTFVFLPRDIPHTFVVEGGRPARLLTLLTPGGSERMFVDGGRTPDHEGLPPAGPPDIEKLKHVAAEYGNEIVGPPLQPKAVA
jgi:quercetin dioxygenase-like cupin family protein